MTSAGPDQLVVAWHLSHTAAGRLKSSLVLAAAGAMTAAPPRGGHVGPILQRAETSVCHQYAVTADAQR